MHFRIKHPKSWSIKPVRGWILFQFPQHLCLYVSIARKSSREYSRSCRCLHSRLFAGDFLYRAALLASGGRRDWAVNTQQGRGKRVAKTSKRIQGHQRRFGVGGFLQVRQHCLVELIALECHARRDFHVAQDYHSLGLERPR